MNLKSDPSEKSEKMSTNKIKKYWVHNTFKVASTFWSCNNFLKMFNILNIVTFLKIRSKILSLFLKGVVFCFGYTPRKLQIQARLESHYVKCCFSIACYWVLFQLVIVVRDGGSTSLKDEVTIRVNIIDIADSLPHFTQQQVRNRSLLWLKRLL